ncbi:E3 ubiquitin-protein ligase RNF170-like isoform X3 [Lagopus muta]|uniref:E3 ubiquitin-protein ligase RNF170-like isoform X3 n=1 Tax=Lagopus muta TaxID=64668 RepID=UPI00209ECC4C|nr:E3 ubiquitin-protein ligase RNF170-like isoform X3 [Lagopus muta]
MIPHHNTDSWHNLLSSSQTFPQRGMESLQVQQPSNHSDFSCPICLQTVTLPVETNCGHLFCGSCLITYWKHGPWLGAIICPLCRQKVVVLVNISCEKLHDKPSKQTVHDIRAYNKRFSGQPRPGDPKEVPGADLQLSEKKASPCRPARALQSDPTRMEKAA